jgi:hypothetical protein
VLIRSWNVFHGNAVPPARRAYLDVMIDRAISDCPSALCLQEVPAWALGRFTVGDVSARPMLGPVPIPAAVGRLLTTPHHGRIRSAFSGQGNAIALAPGIDVLARYLLELNPPGFRRELGEALGLDRHARRAWASERRIAHAVRVPAGPRNVFLANMHCTSYPADGRIPDVELRRAADWAIATAAAGDVVVLAGDFNVRPSSSETLAWLASPEGGFSAPGPGIDHVLVKGAEARPPVVWPEARRRHDGRLLSDHAPVEVEIP